MSSNSSGCVCSIVGFIGVFIYSFVAGFADKRHRVEACQFYVHQIRNATIEDTEIEVLTIPPDVEAFSAANLPLLHSKWTQVRDSYKTISKHLKLMKKKHDMLVIVYGENKASKPSIYTQWVNKQQQERQKLHQTHEKIKKSVEKYYAEAEVRKIDSDAEIKAEVNGLLKAADIVLQEQATR